MNRLRTSGSKSRADLRDILQLHPDHRAWHDCRVLVFQVRTMLPVYACEPQPDGDESQLYRTRKIRTRDTGSAARRPAAHA